jgi:hypothetical protein
MFREHISGEKRKAGAIRSSTVLFRLVNIPVFTGREGAIKWILPSVNLVVLALRIARALWMRRHRPDEYRLIGQRGEK